MFAKKEIFYILAVTLIIAFSLSFLKNVKTLPYVFLSVLFIIVLNATAKKIAAHYLDSEIEVKIWEVHRFGFKPKRYFKKPMPFGGFIPLISAGLSYGYFVWMASLVFDVKAKIYRAARRYGLYTYSEMTEYHIALIAAAGIIANLVFSVMGYLIGGNFLEISRFAELNIYYAFFNLIPLSDLDGNKIFFGSIILWSFLAAITLVGMAYVFLVV